MKKLVCLTLLIAFATAGIAYAALTKAADTGTAADGAWYAAADSGMITFPSDNTNGPLIQFKPSANVSMAYNCTDGTIYTLGSYHSSGTKLYGTSSVEAKIYMFDLAAAGEAAPPGDTAPTTTIPTAAAPNFSTGWSAIK